LAQAKDPIVGLFARAMAAPSDRNLIDLYADAGVNFIGLWDRRPDDTFGVAASYSRISPAASGGDADAAFCPLASPRRSGDLRAYLSGPDSPWISQPDFQYIFHPGGGALNPLNPAAGSIPDSAVLGIRTAIKFWRRNLRL
jgi:porin